MFVYVYNFYLLHYRSFLPNVKFQNLLGMLLVLSTIIQRNPQLLEVFLVYVFFNQASNILTKLTLIKYAFTELSTRSVFAVINN